MIITLTYALVPLAPPVVHSLVSDHFSIICQLPVQKLPPESKTVSFKKTDAINIENLKQNIIQSQLVSNPPKDNDKLVQLYDTLSNIYDTHAPMKVKVVKIRPETEWFDDELASEKLKKRRAERTGFGLVLLTTKKSIERSKHPTQISSAVRSLPIIVPKYR